MCCSVCCPISWYNFIAGTKKSLLRGFSRQRRTRHDKPKDVAFGMAVRKGDTSPMNRIRHFRVNISDEVLQDLRHRLMNARYPDQIENEQWEYGTELKYLKNLMNYWQETFNWREQEYLLNKFSHYKTRIEDIDIHFVHVKSPVKGAFPILLLHGWPGSFFEFYKIIEPLTDPESYGSDAQYAFDVVCPSLPGYGFSEAAKSAGMDVKQIAKLFIALMQRLGYERYMIQGTDWGGLIASYMAIQDPEHCSGIHINLVLANLEPSSIWGKLKLFLEYTFRHLLFSKEENLDLDRAEQFEEQELAYAQLMQTKPQTLATSDSPVGLAAWIVEKFRTWSDCNGDLDSKFTRDELLTMIMIYWVTNSTASSCRLYYETRKTGRWAAPEEKVTVPVACAIFPKEIWKVPRRWAQAVYNIQQWTVMPAGGHFPALEEPNLLLDDIRAFLTKIRRSQ